MNELFRTHMTTWGSAAGLVFFLGAFLLFVPFYRRHDRTPAGAFLAFTVFFGSSTAGLTAGSGSGRYLYLASLLGGEILIVGGWAPIHRDYWSKEENTGRLVQEGLYRLVRHPQYAGFLLISLGMLCGSPSLLLTLLWPGLAVLYLRLARREEKELHEHFGLYWDEYRSRTRMFLPRFRGFKRKG